MGVLAVRGRSRRPPVLRALAEVAERIAAARLLEPMPEETLVPLAEADDVILLCAQQGNGVVHTETWSQQLAFAHELAARGRTFAITTEPAALFEKSVAWALPPRLIEPRLWNHARQVQEFVTGLEAQGNRTFLSAAETLYWENKAYMHRRFDDVDVPTPATVIVDVASRDDADFDFEPLVVKQEHAAGSSGVRFFPGAEAARDYIRSYGFRPGEHLIVQAVVPGATRDLRLTMVGDTPIRSATYWRIKSQETLEAAEWRTTATSYGSTVRHEEPPARAVQLCARIMHDFSVRTAGFDVMWAEDDLDGTPLVLELSPFFQPNPPSPDGDSSAYKRFKRRRYRADGYFERQHAAYREIAATILDKGFF
jgi:glutathione synthase/RimK-type ligase-like ATP-grasp enzyme